MKKIKVKGLYINLWVLVLFFAAVWAFWAMVYPAHLHFAEQLQCFEFTWAYLWDVMAKPGGVAEYISRFMVQFFFDGNLGPVIMATLITLVAHATMTIGDCSRLSSPTSPLPSRLSSQLLSSQALSSQTLSSQILSSQILSSLLSLTPALLCLAFLIGLDAKLTMPVGLVISLYAVALTNKLSCNKVIEFIVIALTSIMLGFAVGSVFVVYTMLAFIALCMKAEAAGVLSKKISFAGGLCSIVCILATVDIMAACYPYPKDVLMWGAYYNRFITVPAEYNVSTWCWTIAVGTLLLAARYLHGGKKWFTACLAAISVLAPVYCVFLVNNQTNSDEESMLDNLYMSRNDQWNAIIEKYSHGRHAASSYEQAGYNLALAMNDQLADRYFTMPQFGTEGLLPVYQMEYMTPLFAADAYYNMGMINTAQRFYYESMESIADHQKSAWLLKRLTMTALANGRIHLAKSYIHKLKNTLYYSDWANKIEKYADNPDQMDKNAELHRLRTQRTTQESFFDDHNPPSFIAEMLNHEPGNSVAWQYLFTMLMVEGRLDELMQTTAFYTKHFPGKMLPVHVQEAMLYQWVAKTGSINGFPWHVHNEVGQRFMKFAKEANQPRNIAEPIVRRDYGDTFWCYAVFKAQEQASGQHQPTDGTTGASQLQPGRE